jgi:GNAT superfamily N-acetyltransferase
MYLPTEKTMKSFMQIMDSIVDGRVDGVVALAGTEGISVVSNPGLDRGFDLRGGRFSHGWGTYVTPEYQGSGLAQNLWRFTSAHMRSLGYEYSVGEAQTTNYAAHKAFSRFGGEPIGTTYRVRL